MLAQICFGQKGVHVTNAIADPGAALVEWSIAHPDGKLPARQQVHTRKQYTRPARVEDKIPEVLAYMESIKAREATEPWHCRVLEVEESAGIFCFTTDFYVSLLVEHWETLMEHGLRLACDGTHDISNSRIKLIAVGWLAQHDAGVWTAAWRAAVLDPGYGSYSLNAVDSFWKLLDHYVPEEKTLPLRQVMERYEHTGRVFQNDGKWSALCVASSTLVTPALVEEASAELSPRLDWKDGKQVGRMSCRTLQRLLAQEPPLMLEFNTGQENATMGVLQIWKRPVADEIATGVEQQLEDLFGEKAASRGLEHLLGSGFAGDTTAPATPPQVAARLESLIAEGRLPRTTADQRRRNQRTSGTTYGVPDGLKEALEAGYIHPNLPPPQGMVWNLVAHKTFVLQARGG
eukprot:s4523_g1.t1